MWHDGELRGCGTIEVSHMPTQPNSIAQARPTGPAYARQDQGVEGLMNYRNLRCATGPFASKLVFHIFGEQSVGKEQVGLEDVAETGERGDRP